MWKILCPAYLKADSNCVLRFPEGGNLGGVKRAEPLLIKCPSTPFFKIVLLVLRVFQCFKNLSMIARLLHKN